MTDKIDFLGHSSIRINADEIIYVDPFNLNDNETLADIIFITHSHYDHFSKEDILSIKKDTTKIIITSDLYDEVTSLGFTSNNIISVSPNNTYSVDDISFDTIPAYNVNKNFHKKENNWVGYVIHINDISYYIAGDTDMTEEAKLVKCDVAFLPVGGTYTMDYMEASILANTIKPRIVIPIHYGKIVGTIEDANKFKERIDKDINCIIF